MKLLLDENLSRRMIPVIEPCYPGSSQVQTECRVEHDARQDDSQ
ncbi:hypothetical protein [Thiocystis minor]|nr:hypothetical protein [Thiocystis minor]